MDLRDATALVKAIRGKVGFRPTLEQEGLLQQIELKIRTNVNFFRSYEALKLRKIYSEAYQE